MGAFEQVPGAVSVARTLVMSAPELRELVAGEERLNRDGVSVAMSERGFGTRVEIKASAISGLGEAELEGLLDELAEPRRQPFSK